VQSISFRGAVLFNGLLRKQSKKDSDSTDNSLGMSHLNNGLKEDIIDLRKQDSIRTNRTGSSEGKWVIDTVEAAALRKLEADKGNADWEKRQKSKGKPNGKLRKTRKSS